MNKTTSFSKISASKNDLKTIKDNILNLTENTSNLISISNDLETENNPIKNDHLSDSIDEMNLSNNESISNNHKNNNEFINSISFYNNKTNFNGVRINKNSFKTWCSENNLSILTNDLIEDINEISVTKSIENRNKYDFENFELETDLQFSDHADLVDDKNCNYTKNKIEKTMDSQQYLNKYDIYKLTKKNYKLTFNNLSKRSRIRNKDIIDDSSKHLDHVNQNDPLISLLKLKDTRSANNHNHLNDEENVKNIKINNHDNDDIEDVGEYDDEDDDDNDEEDYDDVMNKSSNDFVKDLNLKADIFEKINQHEFLDYLSKNSDLGNISNDANFEESILNWSMKLSNYHMSHKRSHSRSPLSCSNSSFHFKFDQQPNYLKCFDTTCLQNNFNLKENQNGFENYLYSESKNKKKETKHKTSWGKLKHSKSSCSNMSNSMNNSNHENIDVIRSSIINNYIDFNEYCNTGKTIREKDTNDIKMIENLNDLNSKLNILPSTSTPSLFQLFKDSKTNLMLNQDEIKKKNLELFNSKMNEKNKDNRPKKTSFSQLRQKSKSTHAIIDYSVENNQNWQNRHDTSENTSTLYKNNLMMKSIGIQHKPELTKQKPTIVCMLVEGNHKTTPKQIMAAARAARLAVSRRSNSSFCTKSSLPDLTFLKEYSDDKNTFLDNQVEDSNFINKLQPENVNIKLNQINSNGVIGSDLLKRKTLKSIKRYRQTKQNTEPCLLESNCNESQNIEDQSTLSHQNNININNIHTSIKQNFNADEYTSETFVIKNKNNYSNTAKKEKRPLKSCLKRKESQPLNNNLKLNTNMNNFMIDEICQQPRFNLNSQSLINCFKRCNTKIENKANNLSKQITFMFIPSIGYLFTCDNESSTRYRYYNSLEQARRIKIYHQLTHTHLNQSDCLKIVNSFETEEFIDRSDENFDFDYDQKDNKLKSKRKLYWLNNESKSENDLRVKKSVTFVSKDLKKDHAHGIKLLSNQIGLEKISPSFKNEFNPALHYNNLIAMLNSKTSNNIKREKTNENFLKQNLIDYNISNIEEKMSFSNKENQMKKIEHKNSLTKNDKYIKKYQIIDADSISLASLSESPPSEFKFSDEEDGNLSNSLNKQNSNIINSKISKNLENEQSKDKLLFKNDKKNEQDKYLKIQQIKLNQNNKKNLNNILLSDNKLNNLRNLINEMRQQQKKFEHLKSDQDKDFKYETRISSTNSSSTSTSSNGSTLSSTINSNTTTTNKYIKNFELIEFKETFDRFSQLLFEFLKQGLKSISLDSALNSFSQNYSNSISIKSPPESPISFAKQQIESNSLTITFSQYSQIWNIIEHTMNLNFLNENNQIFILPKDAYLAMFQEINRYANNINHTYLIDTRANTSQLRRKHHFMVLLIALKYKFQLFIMYLLCYHQLANWFEFLKNNRNLLKTYYDLKENSEKKTEESNEFIQSSILSSSSSIYMTESKFLNSNSNSSSTTSNSNSCIFENEEYFVYFHKLLQQFSFIDFNLEFLKRISQSKFDTPSMNNEEKSKCNDGDNNDTLNKKLSNKKPIVPLRKISGKRVSNNSKTKEGSLNSFISESPNIIDNDEKNKSISKINEINSSNNNSSSGGFNLKSISKKLNFKSWFTSSNSQLNQNSKNVTLINNFSKFNSKPFFNNQAKNYSTVISNQAKQKYSEKSFNKNQDILDSNILLKPNNESIMKHSLSEPSINALIH